MPVNEIQYSERYYDDVYAYRHVILPPDIARLVPKSHLMTETEWRNLGVRQSPGWIHFMVHNPEPHVLLFRRPRTDFPASVVNGLDSTTSSSVKSLCTQCNTYMVKVNIVMKPYNGHGLSPCHIGINMLGEPPAFA